MSIESYLDEISDSRLKYTQNEQEIHINCPFCDDTRSRFFVNTNTHLCHCFNCDYSASFITFLMDLEHISYADAVERYKDIKGSSYIPDDVIDEIHNNLFTEDVSHNIQMRPIPLPKEYIPLNFSSKNVVMKSAIKYLMKDRRISIRQMKMHEFGICVSGEYSRRIIIPILESGKPLFFVARYIGNNSPILKEKSPSNESYQISKSQVIFNIDNASSIFDSCVISEGIFDALSFGDIGVSLLGKRLSDDQMSILLDYRDHLTNGVYIALDWDARNDAMNMARELSKYFRVYIINMPKGDLKNGYDPNDYYKHYGRKAMYDLIDNAVEYDFSYFLRRKFFV